MKKLVLTIVALVAVSATSFAQYFTVYTPCSYPQSSYSSPRSTFNAPPVSNIISVPSSTYSLPSVSIPSTVNYSTTTVSGHSRSNGTYVDSYVRSMPNTTNWDNFSTRGNSNPFTGSTGYRARDYSSDAYNYGAGHTIHTGSRGGQYYYNSNGHKTYVPKRSLW